MSSSSRAAAGSAEVVALALRHLGMRDGVYVAPSIPPAKEAGARAVHAAHLPESEAILVLYDDTAFGGAKHGFVATAERVCWKNLLQHPHQIPWGEVDPGAVAVDGREVRIARGGLSVSTELAEDAARFVVAMAERARVREGSPYRESGAAGVVTRLVALARRHVGLVEDAFYHPAIPEAKLRGARAVHAGHLPGDEVVAVLWDATVFGGAADGFLITPERLCWKTIASEPKGLAWQAIDVEGITAHDNTVVVMGGEILLSGAGEMAGPAAALFTVIAAKARSDGGI